MNKIPETATVNTGDGGRVHRTIDDFFSDTIESLEKDEGADRRFFEVKSGNITKGGNMMHVTDDRLTYLSYKGYIIACVTETRTEFNYVRYTFFRNTDAFPRHLNP